MDYRVANVNDAKQIDNLLTKLIADEKQYDNTLENIIVKDFYKNIIIKNNHIIYLCEDKGTVVAYIYTYINDKNEAIIDALFVEEEYRNKHIASNLIKLAKTWIKEKNIKNIKISVLSDNKIAKQLYIKFGFKPFKEILKIEL